MPIRIELKINKVGNGVISDLVLPRTATSIIGRDFRVGEVASVSVLNKHRNNIADGHIKSTELGGIVVLRFNDYIIDTGGRFTVHGRSKAIKEDYLHAGYCSEVIVSYWRK